MAYSKRRLVLVEWRDAMPELVIKYDEDHIEFRGHVLNADTLEIA